MIVLCLKKTICARTEIHNFLKTDVQIQRAGFLQISASLRIVIELSFSKILIILSPECEQKCCRHTMRVKHTDEIAETITSASSQAADLSF